MTLKNPNLPDAGWDPIASDAVPFSGDFWMAPSYAIHVDDITNASGGTEVKISSNLLVTGDTSLNKTLTVTGSTLLKDTLTVDKKTTLNDALDVSGYSHFFDNVLIDKNATVNENFYVSGEEAKIKNYLEVVGYEYIQGKDADDYGLKVVNKIYAGSGVDIAGDLDVSGNLYVTGEGKTAFIKNLSATFATITSATITKVDIVESESYGYIMHTTAEAPKIIDIQSLTAGVNNFYLSGDTLYSNSWGYFEGELKTASAFYADGPVTFADTLNVAGKATFDNEISAASSITTKENLYVSGNETVSGFGKFGTYVSAASSDADGYGLIVEKKANIKGNTDIGGTLGVTGAVDFDSTLKVDGATTLNGDTTVNANLTVEKNNKSTVFDGEKIYRQDGSDPSKEYLFPDSGGKLALQSEIPVKVSDLENDAGYITDETAEPLLFAQYYPEGNVKSAAEFTEGIKYNFDTTNHTATVKPFCNTGNSANDNSSLVGRVVIPPFVDAQDNGYISDDGTRYKVVGVGSGTDSNNSNENLTAVIAPSTVAKIEDKAFRRCTKLASVSTTAATSIGSGAFNTCTSLASVSLPAVDSIGTYAFSSCTKLASVSIPAATKIQNYAFYSCTKLTSVSIPAAKSIGGHVFDGCTKLASVSLPAATSVGGSAFNNCNSLASVSLPVVTSIDGYSFAGCTSLTSVDFGETLSSVPTLGSNAFSSVPTSCKIIVPDAQYDAWTVASGWRDLYNNGNGYKFLKHSEWEYVRKYEIDSFFFAQYYPDGSVKSAAEFTQGIKYDAPDTSNRTITVRPFCDVDDDSEDDNSNLSGRVVIPPFVDAQRNPHISDDGTRYRVVGVSGCNSLADIGFHLTAIVAPNTVTSIGNKAFVRCGSLTSISLPSATTIGESAFKSCTKLASVSLPAATSVGGSAFNNCTSLTSVSLPSATTIGDDAFSGCTMLTSVNFGETLSSAPRLGSNAFSSVPTSCKIIVPDGQYDAWTAETLPDGSSNPWYALVTAGYKFLKYSEWEYARKYEVDGKLNKMEAIAWSSLKAKRDEGTLVPGQWYRITDYKATTVQADTQSANHRFDIIVRADSSNKLNENAYAIKNAEDTTYFVNSKLEAWQVWYCLDNDINRFVWADSANGKGVVYRLIDEFNNDCPYDFKGITMKAYGDTDNVFRYTFDSGSASDNTDYSLSGSIRNIYNNVIGRYLSADKLRLNKIIFKGNNSHSNTFGTGCYSNTFGENCHSNTFGNGCYSNTFGNECHSNTFGNGCYSNTFGNSGSSNTFGGYYSSNTFKYRCTFNTFGNFGSSNTFGEDCHSNTFGDYCSSNTLGDYCNSNTFRSYSSSNTFGNRCSSNTFGTGCDHILFKNDTAKKNYVSNIIVEDGNRYITLNMTGTSTSSAPYRNVTLAAGLNNTTTNKTITDSTNGGQTFKTVFQPANSQVISV